MQDDISTAISRQYIERNGTTLDLAQVAPGAWDRVCILGPYSNNDTAKKTLGFEWDAKSKTSIELNDGISLLIFVQSNEVIGYVEHPRRNGDFSNLTTKCFPRQSAKFFYDQKPNQGWPGLFHKNAA